MKTIRMRTLLMLAGSILFLLLSATTCDEDSWEGYKVNKLHAIAVTHYDHTQAHPIKAEDACPMKAYMLRVSFFWENQNYADSQRNYNQFESPLVDFRIMCETENITSKFCLYPPELEENCIPEFFFPTRDNPLTRLSDGYVYLMLNDVLPSGSYRFKVELEFEDGNVIADESDAIELY